MPNCSDLAKIHPALFALQLQFLFSRRIFGDQANFGGELVGIKTKRPAALLPNGSRYRINRFVVTAPRDDENNRQCQSLPHASRASARASEIGYPRSRSSIPHSPPGFTSRKTHSPVGVSIRSTAPYTRPNLDISRTSLRATPFGMAAGCQLTSAGAARRQST